MQGDPFATLVWPKRLAARLRRWGLVLRRPLKPARIRPDRPGPPNLLVLAVDTLRWDHLGLAGYARPVSPAIDRLADAGATFTNVMAPAPWTLPSFASSLTGLLPGLHGAGLAGPVRNMDQQPPRRLAATAPTMAQHLRQQGYRTATFYANPFFAFGLAESFDYHQYANLPSDELAFLALEWIRRHGDRPFFCFVLFNDPHEPTMPKTHHLQPLLRELAAKGIAPTGKQLRSLIRWGDQATGGVDLGSTRPRLSEPARVALAIKLALYDGAITQVDASVDRMLGQLATWRLRDRTLVTIYSDHGEEFLDHAEEAYAWRHDPRRVRAIGHGHSHFEELLHVPWLAAGPGVPRGIRCAEPISLCDVAPTLVDWLGLPPFPLPAPPAPGLVGCSAAPLLARDRGEGALRPAVGQAELATAELGGQEGPARLRLAEEIAYGPDLVAVRQGDWKLIAHRQGEPLALYHLGKDPLEKQDRRHQEPEILARLDKILCAWRETLPEADGDGDGDAGWQDISAAVRRRLRDLGYTE